MSEPQTHLDEWQVFTNRYGLHRPDDETWADKMPWAARHKQARSDANAKPHHWCRCPGPSSSGVLCSQKATEEDGLCNECRRWCVAVDGARQLHLLADVRPDTGWPTRREDEAAG